MNVLILTPDAVGSTLLQRTLTVYMQFYEFDRPVINLHELSNGISKYYSPEFNQELLGKKEATYGYYQTLTQVTELLESVDHYKTSRLAHYHIRRRQDPFAEQIPFYNYLNENFYIISCRRKNVFEHALSWAINKVTKKLNVYSPVEKVEAFVDLYKNKIVIDQENLTKSLNDYKDYIAWCEHFEIASYFEYEKDVPNIERFILDLPFFTDKQKSKTWKDVYGITFEDWNKCHFYTGDIGSIALDKSKDYSNFVNQIQSVNPDDSFFRWESDLLEKYYTVADDSWPRLDNPLQLNNLDDKIKKEISNVHNIDIKQLTKSHALSSHLPESHVKFLSARKNEYINAMKSMQQMVKLGIITSTPPMKKQTLAEKKLMVQNFDQCLATFNEWADKNTNIVMPIEDKLIEKQVEHENDYWRSIRLPLLDKK